MPSSVPTSSEFNDQVLRINVLEENVTKLDERLKKLEGGGTGGTTPTPVPPTPTPTGKYYSMINGPDWDYGGGNNIAGLQKDLLTDYSVFVYVPTQDCKGWTNLGNEPNKKAIADAMHAAGKKCTASIGGGGASFTKTIMQNILGNATYRTNLAASAKSLCTTQGYDGVKIDFEWYDVNNPNGSKNEANMLDLVQKLRTALGPDKLVNMDLIHTNNGIFTAGNKYPDYVNAFSVMVYDIGTVSIDIVKQKMNGWATVLPKNKLLLGMAYGQYTQTVFGQGIDFVKSDSFGGIMGWDARTLTQPWYDIMRQKLGPAAII